MLQQMSPKEEQYLCSDVYRNPLLKLSKLSGGFMLAKGHIDILVQ